MSDVERIRQRRRRVVAGLSVALLATAALGVVLATTSAGPGRHVTTATEPSGSQLPFADHKFTRQETDELDHMPPAQGAGRADFAVPVAQSGSVLVISVTSGACSFQRLTVQSVVRQAPDRLVVNLVATPPFTTPPSTGRQMFVDCGRVGVGLGLSVTLPSDERFTGTIDVRRAG